MTPSDIINKAVKAAFKSPKRIKEFMIDTPYGKANVRIELPFNSTGYPPKKKTNKSKKENVWDKLLKAAGYPELSDGKEVISKDYKKYLYGKGGIIN